MKLLLKTLFVTIVFSSNVISAPAYIIPTLPGWQVQPIITVGEQSPNGYTMAGVPDGLGVFANNDGTFSLLCLLYTSPSPRDQRGSRMPSSA